MSCLPTLDRQPIPLTLSRVRLGFEGDGAVAHLVELPSRSPVALRALLELVDAWRAVTLNELTEPRFDRGVVPVRSSVE